MSIFAPEVAHPALFFEGSLGRAEPILIAGGRPMADQIEAFVGSDFTKLKNAIAAAESGRDGEVRYFSEVAVSDASMPRIIHQIAAKFAYVFLVRLDWSRTAVRLNNDFGVFIGLVENYFCNDSEYRVCRRSPVRVSAPISTSC